MRLLIVTFMFVTTLGLSKGLAEEAEDELAKVCEWRFEVVRPTEIQDGEQLYDIVVSRSWPDGHVDSTTVETPFDAVPGCFRARTPLELVGKSFVFLADDPVDVLNLLWVMARSGTCDPSTYQKPKPEHVLEQAAQDLAAAREPNLSNWDFYSIRLMFESYLEDPESRAFLVDFLSRRVVRLSEGKLVLIEPGPPVRKDETEVYLELVSDDETRTLRIVPQRKPFWLEPARAKQQAKR